MVEARATAKYIRVSPRRAGDVIALIRGKTAEEALNILAFTPKKSAGIALKVLRSAISNAANKDKNAKAEDMVVVEAYIGQGPVLKRYWSRARGHADMITRRTSHITIRVAVEDKKGEDKSVKNAKHRSEKV